MSVFVILYVHFEFGTLSFSNSCGFFQLFLVFLDLLLVLRNLLFEFFNLALQGCNGISHLVDVARRYNSLPGVTRTVALALFLYLKILSFFLVEHLNHLIDRSNDLFEMARRRSSRGQGHEAHTMIARSSAQNAGSSASLRALVRCLQEEIPLRCIRLLHQIAGIIAVKDRDSFVHCCNLSHTKCLA